MYFFANLNSFKKLSWNFLRLKNLPNTPPNNKMRNHFAAHFIEYQTSFYRLFFNIRLLPPTNFQLNFENICSDFSLHYEWKFKNLFRFNVCRALNTAIIHFNHEIWSDGNLYFLQTHNRFHTNSQSKEQYFVWERKNT